MGGRPSVIKLTETYQYSVSDSTSVCDLRHMVFGKGPRGRERVETFVDEFRAIKLERRPGPVLDQTAGFRRAGFQEAGPYMPGNADVRANNKIRSRAALAGR